MNDDEIIDELINDIEQEMENYENMKSNIWNQYKVKTDLIKIVKRINK